MLAVDINSEPFSVHVVARCCGIIRSDISCDSDWYTCACVSNRNLGSGNAIRISCGFRSRWEEKYMGP